jgi:UDP-2,4-diacetamido-2,4,6-trideoxy-beta-L-altropyranose hydrolase
MSLGALIIRADASPVMGHGHVMRCLALAQAWQDAGGEPVFVIADLPAALAKRLHEEGVLVVCLSGPSGTPEDAAQLVQLAQARKAAWVVVDGYHFFPGYQRVVKDAGLKLLLLDDIGGGNYCADLVLNQNLHASEEMYASRQPYTRLLLGTRYAMLRREFARWREWKRETSPEARKVLVTMGGSDPQNITARAVEALGRSAIEGLDAAVVIGGSNPHREALQQLAEKIAGVRFHQNVAEIAELMAWADVAISAAGATCWEMCLLGLPSLLIDLAPNQRPLAEELQRRGAAIHLGSESDTSAEKIAGKLQELARSPETRGLMAQRARGLVDGKGAARVVRAMRGAGLRLRRAEEKDCRMLWEWANDPEVRAASFSQAPIPWEEHVAWFDKKRNDPHCCILVATEAQGLVIGQFRVDWLSGKEGEVDVSVAPAFRGSGYGAALIDGGAQFAFQQQPGEHLHAFVKLQNVASRRAFEDAGFQNLGEATVKGHPVIHYIRGRNQQEAGR